MGRKFFQTKVLDGNPQRNEPEWIFLFAELTNVDTTNKVADSVHDDSDRTASLMFDEMHHYHSKVFDPGPSTATIILQGTTNHLLQLFNVMSHSCYSKVVTDVQSNSHCRRYSEYGRDILIMDGTTLMHKIKCLQLLFNLGVYVARVATFPYEMCNDIGRVTIAYPRISADHAVKVVSTSASEKSINANNFLSYLYFGSFNLSWKPYNESAPSHGDNSFSALGLLEKSLFHFPHALIHKLCNKGRKFYVLVTYAQAVFVMAHFGFAVRIPFSPTCATDVQLHATESDQLHAAETDEEQNTMLLLRHIPDPFVRKHGDELLATVKLIVPADDF
ncbi:hypothetical protein A4A49_38181 [Nicotiana attenuata]|uniref:Uncharacterized protein n=1 Tax=Nicotiana attenuata TaxID=49451 RepID=A0A1J6IPQ5_NICAT|nr:hypothetical protein A4A49_38181 [Nicotiana attenuata]